MLGTPPYFNPRMIDLWSSRASRMFWRTSTKSGWNDLKSSVGNDWALAAGRWWGVSLKFELLWRYYLVTLVALRNTVMETLTPLSEDAAMVNSLNSACSTRMSQSPRIFRPRKYFDLNPSIQTFFITLHTFTFTLCTFFIRLRRLIDVWMQAFLFSCPVKRWNALILFLLVLVDTVFVCALMSKGKRNWSWNSAGNRALLDACRQQIKTVERATCWGMPRFYCMRELVKWTHFGVPLSFNPIKVARPVRYPS